jgi:hypothetical protein
VFGLCVGLFLGSVTRADLRQYLVHEIVSPRLMAPFPGSTLISFIPFSSRFEGSSYRVLRGHVPLALGLLFVACLPNHAWGQPNPWAAGSSGAIYYKKITGIQPFLLSDGAKETRDRSQEYHRSGTRSIAPSRRGKAGMATIGLLCGRGLKGEGA